MKNILVLEDDRSNLEIFTTILCSSGYSVLEATTSQEAFDAAQRQPKIDLFVSDVGLKGENVSGTAVAVALAQSCDSLPVVFVTGTPLSSWIESDRQNLRLLLSAGVEVLEKPFMPRVFERAVERLLTHTAKTDAR